ncbi:hypothetical protein BGZ92_006072 [Podila epicladia]|nr:hypothetical protein BGZ92_006072 [Podila epicladia]
MKISFIIAAVAFAASVSAQTASDVDLETKWCQVFTASCAQGATTACGSSPTTNNCKADFTNGVCTQYLISCDCTTADGKVLVGNTPALKSTFAATEGACSQLERRAVPNPSNSTSPHTTGASPTSTGSTPTGTAAPGKGNSAGKTTTNAFLAVAAAVGAASLAL